DLHARPARHDGFAAFALITARQPIDLECRPRGTLLDRREASFAKQSRHAEEFSVFIGVEWQARKFPFLIVRQRLDVVVKARDRDSPIFVAHFADELAERHRWVIYRAPENARMQIARRTVERNFKGSDAAQGISQCRMFSGRHTSVRNHYRITAQL